jgi:uncharacterized membrane protein YhaH (DUF805 family)
MKELTLQTLIAVFEEMFGATLFWAMVAVAVIITVLFVYVLIRDRRVYGRKFLAAQIALPVGAVAAVWFLLWVTGSRLSDIGGPIDAILLLVVAAVGAVGLAILAYTLQALLRRRRLPETGTP